ncbi:MAG: 2-dehydro-3-deoxygalactonokinase [Daejeonella sp.]|uniref:2-dehydro-3-deoxygalactonokinase n=1 Tax=Daejeonella sp. TaxID=2805397 RepID=UPI0027364010|nr:2-dehydro-3-deoxygalactonokinase [Daejeonella sp.]MDP3469640.1 2-dehydro-3-deoxygalactonokinase [Daejeonella sp.]
MNKYILCCDWGTTSFRLRLVDRNTYDVIAELLSPGGVAGTFRSWKEQTEINRFDFYSVILKSSIRELEEKSGITIENTPLIVSGMASSSLGMEEIPYAELPFNISGIQASVKIYENFNGPGANLVLVSGVKSYEDVMRGEEAQLIGLIKINEVVVNGQEQLLFVFPGTHSKHIFVKDDLVTDFKTFMTGEIFNILSEHSILKDSVDLRKASGLTEAFDIKAFKRGVEVSGSSSLLHNLFTVRTMQLFGKFSKEQNSYYLSGLLIGTELRQLQSLNYDHLVICSGKHLYEHYKIAVEMLSFNIKTTFVQPELIDKATIAGQVQLFNAIQTYKNE